MTGPKGNCFFVRSGTCNAKCLTPIEKPELIVVTFHHFYRVSHCPPDTGNYGFAFVRWTLNAIAILTVSAAMLMGTVISSAVIQHWS
jgi:hypothetical protein